MTYDAFISYGHDTDGDLAKAIEDGLERFTKPWYRRRSLSVFRDNSGLSANPGLWTSLTEVMEDSDRLIVLCSPDSAASPWVGREIEHWIATKPTGRILPVLTAGELVWDDELGTFDSARSTAAHPALAGAFAEEPLWTDLRFADDPQQLSLRDPRFRDAIAVLAAPMHGVPKDELIGEDIRQHRRTLQFAWGAVVALLVLAFGTFAGAATAFNKANEAQRYADEIVAANESLGKLEQERDSVVAERKKVEAQVVDQKNQLKSAQDDLAQATAETEAANAATEEANAETEAANAETAAAKEDAAAAGDERDSARADAVAAGDERDSARADAWSAGKDRDAALSDARLAGKDRDAARSDAAAAGVDRDKALSDAVAASKDRDVALSDAAKAQVQAAVARDAASSATRLQQAAEVKRVEAERAQAEADEQRAIADQQAAESRQVAEEQTSIAKSTRLANDSNRVRAGQFDLSLLLANEATNVDSGVPDAHGALLTAVSEGSSIDRFLHFGCASPATFLCVSAPQRLGKVSVSPDGQFVAAVEDSSAIQNGDAKARLYVWANAAGPSVAQVSVLSDDLACVQDLQWLQGNILLTVEEPLGCVNPDLLYDSWTAGVAYAGTGVQLWEPRTGAHRSVCNIGGLADAGFPDHGLAIKYRSPLSVSDDARVAAVTCELFTPDIAATYFIDGPTMAGDAESGWNLAFTDASGVSFSPSGRYAAGWFDESDLQARLRQLGILGTDEGVLDWLGLPNNVPRGNIVWDAGHLADSGGLPGSEIGGTSDFWRGLTFGVRSDGVEVVAARRRQVEGIDVWGLDGSLLATMSVPGGVTGSTFADPDVLVYGDSAGIVHITHWPSGLEVRQIPTPAGCAGAFDTPSVTDDLERLVVLRNCLDSGEYSSIVIDTGTGTVLRELRGNLVHISDDGRYVVTEQLDLLSRGGVELYAYGFELWEFDPARSPSGRLAATGTDMRPVVSPDGSTLAGVPSSLVSDQENLTVWHLLPEGIDGPIELPGSTGTRALDFTREGEVVGVGRMGAAVVWDLQERPYRTYFAESDPTPCPIPGYAGLGGGDSLLRSAVSPDGRVRARSLDARRIELIDVATGAARSLPTLALVGDERIDYFSFSPDGGTLLVRLETPTRDPAPNQFRCRFGDPAGSSVVVPISASAAPERVEGNILKASRDGRRILLGGPGSTVIVRATDGLEVAGTIDTAALPPAGIVGNIYTLDSTGSRVAGTNSTGRTVVWSVETGKATMLPDPQVQPTVDVTLFGIDFSPGGDHLVVKSVDQVLRRYDLASGSVLTRQLPTDAAARVVHSPDGTIVAVDGVYLYDAATLRPIGGRLWPDHWNDPTRDVGPQSLTFQTGENGALYLVLERTYDTEAVGWRIDVEGLRARSCTIAGRNLTQDEFDLYAVGASYRSTCR